MTRPGDGYENWGVAYPQMYPQMPGYVPVVLVPRPPRPPALNLAVVLTVLGVLVSASQQAISFVNTLAHRDEIVSNAANQVATDPNAPDVSGIMRTATTAGLVVGMVFWLLPAAGALVTAFLARRGYNGARIVLASLMGVYALFGLCGGAGSLVSGRLSQMSTTTVPTGGLAVVGGVIDVVLAGLAIAIGVLVLLPAVNRYYSPGPGRRFAPVPPGS